MTAERVRELREATGCGMARSKALLEMAEGDMETALKLARYDGYAVQCYRNGEKIGCAEMMAGILLAEKKGGPS